MRSQWHKHFATAVAVLLALLVGAPLAQALGTVDLDELVFFSNRRVFGLTSDQRLVRFRLIFPQLEQDIGAVSGLQYPDAFLVGIDFRVQDGQLYGVGNGGGVYTIDTANAQASLVNRLTVALDGTFFGVDFNPAADRLRIVSDTGQNLSHNVNAGGTTALQGTLTYTPPPAAPDAALGITAAAYTNNDLSTNTATTLFDIDTTLDQVAIQSPPGNGILVATGQLGVDAAPQAGFDIASRLINGVTVLNGGFAALVVSNTYGFYHINTSTGQATLINNFKMPVVDIAVSLSQ
jgi:Domain of unknown function (DUF4394)